MTRNGRLHLIFLFIFTFVTISSSSPLAPPHNPTTPHQDSQNARFSRSVTPTTLLDHKTTNVLQRPVTVTHPIPV
ncbi:unnamed protein product [Bursaphelenchus xylophilus]|uniref:(pine wood nematode) hypothetical protein n=1 Tax=Bursaphelenchus xylophilus TaxID=6326 RepID=A0A1I7RSY7_BURXY|nr:unnamed protein product [Bursaphelenchus xylophilus]CAG9122731.1 unnamed protein product [Bursaphelenchus xylophilus]